MASGQIGHFPKFKSVADVSSDLLGLFELIYIYLTSNLVQPILAYVCHTSLVFFLQYFIRFDLTKGGGYFSNYGMGRSVK